MPQNKRGLSKNLTKKKGSRLPDQGSNGEQA